MSSTHYFLFLQGFNCHFLTELAKSLRSRGHCVGKVNFTCGDTLYWGKQKSWHFRAPVDQLEDYLYNLCIQEQITDIVVMGDLRPVHLPAQIIAKKTAARLHVFEEGYMRPNWVTLERNGINGHSQLPKNPDWYRDAGKLVPDYKDGQSFGNPRWLLALHGTAYHLPNCLNYLCYPGYQTHRPVISAIEFIGWGRRSAKMLFWERQDKIKIDRLVNGNAPFYFLPLQLDSDSQIQHHSGLSGMSELIANTCQSFAQHAPSNSQLVIKNHPHDTGLVNYRKQIKALEQQLDIQGRIVYLESGHLPTLLDAARGMITVNSTVGTSALIHKCPTIALGKAIYDLPGLTFQGQINDFWSDYEKPDTELFRCFRNTVIHTTQVNGSFYNSHGVKIAAEGSCNALTLKQSLLEQLITLIGLPDSPMTTKQSLAKGLPTESA